MLCIQNLWFCQLSLIYSESYDFLIHFTSMVILFFLLLPHHTAQRRFRESQHKEALWAIPTKKRTEDSLLGKEGCENSPSPHPLEGAPEGRADFPFTQLVFCTVAEISRQHLSSIPTQAHCFYAETQVGVDTPALFLETLTVGKWENKLLNCASNFSWSRLSIC